MTQCSIVPAASAETYRDRVEALFLDLLACADREDTLAIFLRQFPGIPDAIAEGQAGGETPEKCATRLIGICVPQALCDGSIDDCDKRLARLQIREMAEHGAIRTGQPHRITEVAFNIADMTDRWTQAGLVDRAEVAMATGEIMRAMRSATNEDLEAARTADIFAMVPEASAAVH